MDPWQSENMDDPDGDVIEIIPMDEYDVHKAKARASLSWILFKAYQDTMPAEFKEPFYDSAEGTWQIKPRLANLLASSELYCQACKMMFGENASQWTGHWSIIQVLSRKGIYAVGTDTVDVTETILMQSAPFKLKAHVALIDALMTAFSREIMSIERVTQTVRRFATFNASSELPSDTEDAILFWVNKVCVTVQKHLASVQDTLIEGGETSQKVRIVSSKSPRDSVCVPVMENLLEDMGDGCSVATLISFYCPQILKTEDVCLKSNVGIADSLYNLRLIRSFCERHLPHKTWHFAYEDLLYTPKPIKLNVMMMISELYYWLEVKTLPIATGAGLPQAAQHSNGQVQCPAASRVSCVPISNVTKQSFQRLKADSELRCSSTAGLHKTSPSNPVAPHAPLLHKRQQNQLNFQDDHSNKDHSRPSVQRVDSLTTHDLMSSSGVPRQSVVAWPDKSPSVAIQHAQFPGTTQSQASSNLLANVSIDSEMNASFSSGSIDLGELDSSPRINTERSQFVMADSQDENVINFRLQNKKGTPFPENIELVSVNSGPESRVSNFDELHESAFRSPRGGHSRDSMQGGHSPDSVHFTPTGGNLEPLMPARLKPTKEKINNHTKEEERGDLPKRKTPSPPKVKKAVQIDPHLAVIDQSEICESTDTITPMPDNEMFDAFHTREIYEEHQTNGPFSIVSDDQSPKKYDSFFIRGSVGDTQELMTSRSDATVAESYTIDQIQTPEAAMAAGIPVIDDFNFTPHRLSREGSVASSKSSGEFSDHESHKIHNDHKMQETENKVNNNNDNRRVNENDFSDPGRFIIQKPVVISRPLKDVDATSRANETNFAQIKQMKQFGNIDNSGFVYMQHGQEADRKSSLKDTFQKKQQEKKPAVGSSPNRRTWHQNLTPGLTSETEASTGSPAVNDTATASHELLKIKMKLEEKRKAIERKKHTQEIQQQKILQRLGKAAFLHVLAKPKDDSRASTSASAIGSQPDRMVISDPNLPLASIAESRMTSSTTSSASSSSSPIRSPAAIHPKNLRPISRDDIQQTIENVRKKWFNDDMTTSNVERSRDESPEMRLSLNGEYAGPCDTEEMSRRPVFDRRSTSVERVASLGDETATEGERRREVSPNHLPDRRSVERPVDQNASPKTAVSDIEQAAVNSRSSHRTNDRRSVSVERPVGQNVLPQNFGQSIVDRRSSSAEREGRSGSRRDTGQNDKSESYDVYNSSIDQLNQSLTDLQGEIMKLSLKQRKPEQSGITAEEAVKSDQRSTSPPHALDVRQKTMPERSTVKVTDNERSRDAHRSHTQSRSTSEPRQVQPDFAEDEQIGNYQSRTLPRPQTFQHTQVPPFMMQNPASVAGPAGPVYGTANHFIPGGHNQTGIPPTAQQYGSYIMGPATQQPLGHMQVQAPYQHSPPHGYPGAPIMYPGQPYQSQPIISPQSQPYSTIYGSPNHTQFQNLPPHISGTYTTSAHQQIQYTAPSSQAMPFDPGNQQAFLQQQQHVAQIGTQIQHQTRQTVSSDVPFRQSDNVNNTSDRSRTDVTAVASANVNNDRVRNEGTDIKESPRHLKSRAHHSDSNEGTEHVYKPDASSMDTSQYQSSVIADFAVKVAEQTPHQLPGLGFEPVQRGTEEAEAASGVQQDTSVGFVIGHDDSTIDQSAEEEMQKKKDKIERMRQKRQEEQERKRLKTELETNRKREAERLKMDLSERRKSEEKARRDQIFKQYLVKKEEDEEGPKREKPKQKSRPKSMFVKAGPGSDFAEGYDACVTVRTGSTEDLSPRPSTTSTGANNPASKCPRKLVPKSSKQSMRKAVSCHTLHQNGSGDGRNLAFGGLTHRRPPSPDLYRARRGQRSAESSDAGSAHGGEYSGPKLYVKPSAKSNRHIIINAISHCCLAGSVNTDQKTKVLEEIAKSSAKHFIILFRDASCGYRGLFGFDPDTEDCFKILGVGPRAIHNDMIERYYKYNSGGKSFSQVASTKHLSVSIDAVSLQNTVWKPNKPPPKGMR